MVTKFLGLSKADREKIINEVSIIYHVAASVRFDDPLKDAVLLNMRGTREVCQLALETKNLSVSRFLAGCENNTFISLNKIKKELP